MNVLEYLKFLKDQLFGVNKSSSETIEQPQEPRIEIIIENSSGQFENEEEIIMQGGRELFANGFATSLEDGAITIATMMRGLRYLGKEPQEDGSIKLLFRDNALTNDKPKIL